MPLDRLTLALLGEDSEHRTTGLNAFGSTTLRAQNILAFGAPGPIHRAHIFCSPFGGPKRLFLRLWHPPILLYHFDRMPWSHITKVPWHGLFPFCHRSQALWATFNQFFLPATPNLAMKLPKKAGQSQCSEAFGLFTRLA